MRRRWVLAAAAALLLGAILWVARGSKRASGGRESEPPAAAPEGLGQRVREPAVAGQFYPSDADDLAEEVDKWLGQVRAEPAPRLRGLVCPHAGYVYSGLTAAHCYRLVAGLHPKTVVVMAPSHHHAFLGASIAPVDAYRTPLGLVRVSELAARWSGTEPFVSEPQAHATEHSLEVQLPFLQRTAPQAQIVPIVFGRVDPQAVARRLAEHLPADALVVASSDLSHFHPYDVARRLDQATIDAVLALDLDRIAVAEACGKGPIMALVSLALERGYKARLLDYRNSGDTAGNKAKVVGYAAIAFEQPGA